MYIMSPKAKEILLGIIACMLLLIYSFTLGELIISVYNWDTEAGEFVPNLNAVWVISLIGGIVSAVVIANLAMSDPGETPNSQVREMAAAYGKKLLNSIVWIYIIVWLLIGAGTFYVGVLRCPDVSETLNEMGKSWLGILAGALYAWFGIKKA
jgi:hypothetical protein